ncbi:hypothetical protein [Methanospirillum hungatei]|uniref:hypothetical protein n=1 Tax=Methanospirillum hungatei TaxID=2203 RepID=UPI0026EAF359|nr:hypothetical protein [Methanospirillum hungatei]MCA1917327.1 hypothetical protein [Methanospirillum hungatei]
MDDQIVREMQNWREYQITRILDLEKSGLYNEGLQQVSFIPDNMSSDDEISKLLKEGFEFLCLETEISDLIKIGGNCMMKQIELVHERATRHKDLG